MRRRSVLRVGGTALAGVLAGCSVFEGSGSDTVAVEVITIRNRLDREIEVSVLLVEDERVAYWQSVSVPAGSNPFAVLDDYRANREPTNCMRTSRQSMMTSRLIRIWSRTPATSRASGSGWRSIPESMARTFLQLSTAVSVTVGSQNRLGRHAGEYVERFATP
jgi:hypothetical protein